VIYKYSKLDVRCGVNVVTLQNVGPLLRALKLQIIIMHNLLITHYNSIFMNLNTQKIFCFQKRN